MKKLLLIIINLLFIVIVFFVVDFYTFYQITSKTEFKPSFDFYKFNWFKDTQTDYYMLETLSERKNSPVKDPGKKPIIFGGCSFVYGDGLKEEETLPYRISQIMNVPVRNLGISSKGLNSFLYLIQSGYFDELKNEVSMLPPEVVLYNYADFHISRLVITNIFFEQRAIFYRIKNNKLELKKPPFIVTRSALLSNIVEHLFNLIYENSSLYRDYLNKLLKMHFTEAKKALDAKYPGTKFVILVYFISPEFEKIASNLEEQGFYIIRIPQDFHIDTSDPKYLLPDGHPNALIWEETAPLIAERLEKIIADKK